MADIVIALPRRPRDAELLHLDIAGLSKYDMPEFILRSEEPNAARCLAKSRFAGIWGTPATKPTSRMRPPHPSDDSAVE